MNRYVAILLFSSVPLLAQTNRGGISGTVKDQTGALVPGAAVLVTNVGTNEKRQLVTSPSGAFAVHDLEPVVYNIAVEAKGFRKELVEGVKVDTASVASVTITLQAGSVDTQITVSAGAITVNTESGTTGSTVTERQIQDIPLLNRSTLDMALTQP